MSLTAYAVSTALLYRHAQAFKKSEDGLLYWGLPERLPHEDRDDTTVHTCHGGEFLWQLAQDYYGDVVGNAGDWADIIAQFQPNPIVDRSVPCRSGQEVLIPSLEYIEEVALGDSLMDVQEL
jgi:hypothetical protein